MSMSATCARRSMIRSPPSSSIPCAAWAIPSMADRKHEHPLAQVPVGGLVCRAVDRLFHPDRCGDLCSPPEFAGRRAQETQLRRARQVGQLLLDEIRGPGEARVGEEVQARYAPDLNGRFVRITRGDGSLLYLSSAPKDQTFVPAEVPPPSWSSHTETARQVPLPGGRKILLTASEVQTAGGARYLVETGAPMDDVQAHLRQWLMFLLVVLPVVAMLAVGGGAFLVKRALSPVDRIAASAQRISSQNLSERLPVTAS